MGHQWAPEQAVVDDRQPRLPNHRETAAAAVPAGLGMASRIDGGSRAQLFGALQRTVGNSALVDAGQWRSPVAVQRCGDVPPDSCPCHDDDASSGDSTAGSETAAADHAAP